ncbi:hypothetical protein EDB86DRAFT_3244229 [Lactarius hatsudake]|nr:hypothetical protein EDB86DRAFT_3244229 [Lactarius hatsudake]
MSSREQPSRLNFTKTRGRGGRLRPDNGNRFYLQGSRGRGGARPKVPEYFPIDNVKYVASYNWVEAEKPTMVVPGSPAIWAERAVPFTLEPDVSSIYVDQNTAQLSQYPMLPLFAAVDAIHGHQEAAPSVDWPTVDVVTDRNGLRKLLRLLSPSPGKAVRDFRIDVQLVGTKTLVLSRWESPTPEVNNGRSFGHAFEAAMTRAAPDCPSSGHQRVISYDMFNMKMVVRFGVDACFPSPDSGVVTTSTDDSDLADALNRVNLQQTSTPTTTSPTIDIVRAGTQVPQDALVEVVSRSVYYLDQLDWNELYSQLALSQTPAVRMGVHERGEFKELREWQLEGPGTRLITGTTRQSGTQKGADVQDLSTQRRETAVQIVRLARLLRDVQELAIARGPGPAGGFSLLCEGGKLRVYAPKMDEGGDVPGSCLPPDVVARFETRTDQDLNA